MKKITVVGGGTAGWMTAIYLQKILPSSTITLIESSEIGILGAGEGTTPQIISFLDKVDIDTFELIKETNATLKISIKFEDWSNDGDHYYHPFALLNPSLSEYNYGPQYANIDGAYLSHGIVGNNLKLGKELAYCQFSEDNKSPFYVDQINKLKSVGTFALHFDASLMANYLKKIAVGRNINHVDGKVLEIISDNNEYITGIKLENGQTITSDFVFDCTGFQRLIVGKHFKSKWKSYEEFLPVNSAIGFFLDPVNDIPPYTSACAMKYGWMWKIPLQHRIGCGYVFDDKFIDAKAAQKEVEQKLGHPIKINRNFKFNAGCFETTWVKNCIALGISSGFIEPLEATSIMMLIESLELVKKNLTNLENLNQNVIDEYNLKIVNENSNIMEFLYAHYVTARNDTNFWKKFNWTNAPENLKKKIALWKSRPIINDDFLRNSLFGHSNWLQILNGTNELPSDLYFKELELLGLVYDWQNNFVQYSKEVDGCLQIVLSHSQFLKHVTSK